MTNRGRNIAISSLALVLATVAGCGDADDLSVAVDDARNELSTLSPSGATAAPNQLRNRVYGEVARDLEAAARDASSKGGPALVLASQARAGEAQIAHHAMRNAAAELTSTAIEIQSKLGALLKYQAQADAAEAYDATDDRATVGRQIQSLESELARISQERQSLNAELSRLTAEADGLADEARQTRNRAAELRNQAERRAGDERLALITRAVETGREADLLERNADELRAEFGNRAPMLGVLDRQQQRVRSQLDSASATQSRIDQIAQQRREDARSARARTAAERESVGQRIESMMSTLDGPFTENYQNAAASFDAALGALSRAGNAGARDESRASTGVIAHAALVVERDALGALRTAAQTLANAADAGVVSDGLARVQEMIDAATQRGADLLDRAQSGLQGSGVRDASGDGFNRLAERLEALKPEFGIAPEGEEGS